MTFFDTHCHTYLSIKKCEKEVLDEINKSKKFFIWNVWVDLETSKHVIDLSKKYDFSYAIIWIQPENIWKYSDINETINKLENLAKNKKVIAIWECWLDYYRLEKNNSFKSINNEEQIFPLVDANSNFSPFVNIASNYSPFVNTASNHSPFVNAVPNNPPFVNATPNYSPFVNATPNYSPFVKGARGFYINWNNKESKLKTKWFSFIPYNQDLKNKSRELRKNMTNAEKKIWYNFLKTLDISITRQKPLLNYIVDFFIPSIWLIIEIDWDSHFQENYFKYENKRTKKLENYWLEILRFTNVEIYESFENVCNTIKKKIVNLQNLSEQKPPTPPLQRGLEQKSNNILLHKYITQNFQIEQKQNISPTNPNLNNLTSSLNSSFIKTSHSDFPFVNTAPNYFPFVNTAPNYSPFVKSLSWACRRRGRGFYEFREILEQKKQLEKDWFIAQINLAKKLDLPIVIHNREAWEDIFEILKQTNFKNFIMHCYSENLEYAKKLIDFSPNCKISFSWILTFKNAKNLQEVAKNIELKNIIIETDSPYLVPVPYRWQENYPFYVEKVFDKLCELREEKPELIKNQIWENSLEIFRIKKARGF